MQPPDCDPALGECGSWVVYPYFISFVLLVSMIMLNLFTAVILESFEAQQEQDVSVFSSCKPVMMDCFFFTGIHCSRQCRLSWSLESPCCMNRHSIVPTNIEHA